MQDLLSRLGTLDSKIDSVPIERIARSSGFVRRTARKATARQWLRAICLLTVLPHRSFRTFGWLLGLIEGGSHSKQNVAQRMQAGFECFLREALKQATAKLVGSSKSIDPNLRGFNRIIVQDSTIIGLPTHMVDHFPGASNHTGKPTAGMRVQAFFDLLSESCLHFSISAFTRNDQKASADILDIAQSNDLVIRDLGYCCLSVFRQMKEVGIQFISRFKHGTLIFDENGEPFDLLARLQRQGSVDMLVLVGGTEKLPVRLIAVPVPEAVAAQRRRKARLNRDRRLNPSDQRLRLLGWQILITTVPSSQLSTQDVITLYSLRWRIETLFKAWKSHFRFGSIPTHATATFVTVLIMAGLLYVAVFQCLFQTLQRYQTRQHPHISPLKLASILQNLAAIELQTIIHHIPTDEFLKLTLYYCRYDQRQNPNHYQILNDLSLG